jgi:sirohydrochlorin ferrochelatase
MSLILVAHGTRMPHGVAMIGNLAEQASAVCGHTVHVAFVDVLGPTPSEVLRTTAAAAGPAVVVPAFLSRGFHIHADLPAHVAAGGRPDVITTQALGPSLQAARIVTDQLRRSGWRPDDSVILAAAGSSDQTAQADLRATSSMLSALIRSPVALAFAATGTPNVSEAVAAARSRSRCRVFVASYLLADGLFQDRLRNSGADVVSHPLGAHPSLAGLIASRFDKALTSHLHDFVDQSRLIDRHRDSQVLQAATIIKSERLLGDR